MCENAIQAGFTHYTQLEPTEASALLRGAWLGDTQHHSS